MNLREGFPALAVNYLRRKMHLFSDLLKEFQFLNGLMISALSFSCSDSFKQVITAINIATMTIKISTVIALLEGNFLRLSHVLMLLDED